MRLSENSTINVSWPIEDLLCDGKSYSCIVDLLNGSRTTFAKVSQKINSNQNVKAKRITNELVISTKNAATRGKIINASGAGP